MRSATIADHGGAGLTLAGSGLLRLQNLLFSGNGVDKAFIGSPSTSTLVPAACMDVSTGVFVDRATGNYRLKNVTPPVDSGFPGIGGLSLQQPYDLGHGKRVQGAKPDCGAWEYNALLVDDFESGDRLAWAGAEPD